MKQIIKNFIVAAAILMGVAAGAAAQNPMANVGKWQERMRSERIAFLTAETGMTPAEAQKFWPIYNEAEKARTDAFGKTMQAYAELEKAVNESKPAKDIENKLTAYLNASKASQEIDSNYAKRYLKVLPAEKVARLFVAEEKFRRNQIGRLNQMGRNAVGGNVGGNNGSNNGSGNRNRRQN